MLSMTLEEVAAVLGGDVHFGNGATSLGAEVKVHGCSTDSRTAGPGELFVTLRGPRFDGHDFVVQAARQGVSAAIVERRLDVSLPQLVVPDARHGLARLAKHWRGRFDGIVEGVLCITGSNGKTTVKEMAASCLRAHAPADELGERVLSTVGNLNNDVGLPATVLRQGEQHRYLVLEMGANHPGEIATLAELSKPNVGIVTQCAPAHLEGFGSIEGVARAKGELFEALPRTATAVINGDDPYRTLWTELSGHCARLTFGFTVDADISGRYIADCGGSRALVDTPWGRISVHLPLPGRHNVHNALGVTAACLALGLSLETIQRGLESAPPILGRLISRELSNGARILDDSYNANPVSLAAALDVLRGQRGRHWLVLGDMAELGCEAPRYHRQAGEAARDAGVERLFALGDLSANAVVAFGGAGHHFDDVRRLNEELSRALEPGVTVLVKGSRSMRMERVVAALLGEE